MSAQTHNPTRGKRIIERKWTFIQKRLDLSEDESNRLEKEFFDFENQKAQLNKALKKEVISKVAKAKNLDLSNKELNAIIDRKINIDKELYNLKRDYLGKLRKMLPPAKVIKYYKLEMVFKRELIKRLRKHRR